MTHAGRTYVALWRPGKRPGTYVGVVYHDLISPLPSEPLHLTTGRSSWRLAVRAAELWAERQIKLGKFPKKEPRT